MTSNDAVPHPKEPDQKKTSGFEVSVERIRRSIKSCAKLGQWPMRWDDKSQSVSVDTSAESKLRQGYHVILTLIHCGICVLQLVSTMQDYGSTPSSRIYIIIATVFSSIPLVYRVAFILDSHDIAACLNTSIPFFRIRNYQKFTEGRKQSTLTRMLPLLLQFIYYSFGSISALYFMLLLARPDSPEWITSILPTEKLRNSFAIKLMIFPFYVIWMNGFWTGSTMIVSFTFALAIWAQEVLKDLSDKMTRGGNGRRMNEDLSHYAQMRIIMKIYDQAINTMMPAAKFLVIIPSIYGLYAVVKIGGIVSFFCAWYALDTIFLLELALRLLAQPYVHSRRFLQKVQLRKESRTPLMRRRLRAMKPIAATVGNGMYFIDNQLMLTVMEIIVTNAVNVLLMSEN